MLFVAKQLHQRVGVHSSRIVGHSLRVYLTDESNVQVAIWNKSTGTTLAEPPPPPD